MGVESLRSERRSNSPNTTKEDGAQLLDFIARLDVFVLEQSVALRWAPLTVLFLVASAWWVKGLIFVAAGTVHDLGFRRMLPLAALSGGVAFGLTSLVVMFIKDAVDRARPAIADPTFEALVTTPGSPSFPSGHAATAFAAAAAVGVLCPRLRWPLLGLAGLVALSRVYLGVHYGLDVLVGSALGVAIGIGTGWLLLRLTRRPPQLAHA